LDRYQWLTRRFGGTDKATQNLHVSIAWEHIIVLPLALFAYFCIYVIRFCGRQRHGQHGHQPFARARPWVGCEWWHPMYSKLPIRISPDIPM